jgi:hypothetical protein
VSNAIAKQSNVDMSQIEKLIMHGDLSRLSADQRMSYYRYRCDSMGLDPMSRPFDYLELNGKLVLYLNRGGSEQLRKTHKVSVIVTDKVVEQDVMTVFVRATTPDGRNEDDCGSVALMGAKGDKLANAYMKAITKAKRRATISICGLGMLDESEVETIPGARQQKAPQPLVEAQNPIENFKQQVETIAKPIPSSDLHTHNQQSAKIAEVERIIEPGNVIIPFGSMKGKKLKDFSSDEWRSYIVRVQEALKTSEMPEDKREEAIEVIEMIEEYINP